ncbi:MAG: shikimate kinase [Ruminococcus sp.]|nr:shikimate kinase [Ruminococcus sp.]
MAKNIVLCGFMGCGKTTVGENLRRKLGVNLIDTDSYIEKNEGMTISEIFEKHGESYFRDLEHKACKELSEKKGIIISTGGGALTFERNVEVLKKTGTIVLIDVPLDVLKERLSGDKSRPLLQREDKDKAMQELYDKRMPLYKNAADIVIDGNNSPLQVAMSIINATKI